MAGEQGFEPRLSRDTVLETAALPIRRLPYIMVRVTGFEPAMDYVRVIKSHVPYH